ncbi:MAG: glycosyltransferase family 39 protein [Nanoarchaeota archaeon]|nr:glycosyltransferase family 39 protein [Nanoarchaeota archaeon]
MERSIQYLRKLKKHKEFILLFLIASLLIFLNLGDRALSGDEYVAVRSPIYLLEHGYPLDTDLVGQTQDVWLTKVGSNEVWRLNTWLREYLIAGSLKLFGITYFAYRFPFALFGLLTILLVYIFANEIYSKKIALISSMLLSFNILFILHVRFAAYYSISIFFFTLSVYMFHRYLNEKKNYLALSLILLFHSNLFCFFTTIFTFAAYYFFFHKKNYVKILKTYLFIALFTLPWFVLTNQFDKLGITTHNDSMLIRIGLFVFYFLFFIFPAIFIFDIKRYIREKFLIPIIVLSLFFMVFIPTYELPQVRYLVFLLPIVSIMLATTIVSFKKLVALICILSLITTNVLYIFPLGIYKPYEFNMSIIEKQSKNYFIERSMGLRFDLFNYLYEITHHVDTAEQDVIDFLNSHGSPYQTVSNDQMTRGELFFVDKVYVRETTLVDWYVSRKEIDLPDYNMHILLTTSDVWSGTPDLVHHRFNNDRKGVVYIYEKRDLINGK